MSSDDRAPTRRLVLLGASNLSRGLPTLLATARRAWSEPLDVIAAAGRGRSYGLTSALLGRELTGLLPSALWQAWHERPDLPTSALVTDVGNDVMYGVPVDEILTWVEETLRRLGERGASTVVTALPMERLRRLNPRTYRALRTLLFPRNRDDFASALERAEAVDAGVRRLAKVYGAALVDPSLDWYGFDPIHIRRRRWSAAWRTIVAAWRPPQAPPDVGVAPWSWIAAQLWRPAERRLFGMQQRRAQPCVTFTDGTRVSLF